jgi:trigger factor
MRRLIALLLAAVMVFSLTACRRGRPDVVSPPDVIGSRPSDETPNTPPPEADMRFMSEGIDENGFFIGINALDIIGEFEFLGLEIPAEVHEVSPGEITSAMIDFLQNNAPRYDDVEVINRAVRDGDIVNIDYVGSIKNDAGEWEEFTGGNSFESNRSVGGTGDEGFEVVAGTEDFIDDFLWQIIGMNPGETKEILVSFPDPYPRNTDLSGVEAKFVTTINFINEGLNDEYVADNLSAEGWKTVAEFRSDFHDRIQRFKIKQHLREEGFPNVDIDAPEAVIDLLAMRIVEQERQEAEVRYRMDFREYLRELYGFEDEAELKVYYHESNTREAILYLALQAVAEFAEITVTYDEMVEFLRMNSATVEWAEDYFGLPYIYWMVMHESVWKYIIENAVLL